MRKSQPARFFGWRDTIKAPVTVHSKTRMAASTVAALNDGGVRERSGGDLILDVLIDVCAVCNRHVPDDDWSGDGRPISECGGGPRCDEHRHGERDESARDPRRDFRGHELRSRSMLPATVVPAPGALVTVTTPPIASSRSAMPCNPVP